MEAIMRWGLDVIMALQQFRGPALDSFFRAVTFLGAEQFYLLLLPLLLWCVDVGVGARVGVLLLLSSHLNLSLKELFHQPRPFDLDPKVQLTSGDGYGLPSGHAQLGVVVWGSISAWSRKAWVWGLAIGLIVLVGFSRVYLGVHFPTDILAGWAVGGISLGLYLAAQVRVGEWLAGLDLGRQLLLAIAVPLLLLVIYPVKDTATAMGTLAGAGLGLVLTHRYLPFSARGPWRQRALRFVIGSVVVVPLYLGLKMVFPGETAPLYLHFRTLQFSLIGLWATFGAPWLFHRLGLAPLPCERA
jgi:membrane-associated phospholipid phosphatase